MQTFDFTPFYRSTVGFDRLFNRLDSAVGQEAKSYPPYNIERLADDQWRVIVAVAGFAASDIAIEVEQNNLTIKGAKAPESEGDERQFLHRGIAERSFELRYQLGDYVEVTSAGIENGLLSIELKREVPDSKKPRKIEIQAANGAEKVIENKKELN